ncbi:MAG: hypothetical protein WCE79_02520 [Xanthobacteraceae bacterium]
MLSRQILRPALFALALVAAAPAFAADPVFPTASRIGMAVPAGFTPSNRFAGFENPQASALIALTELPADAYADVEKGFNDEALKTRGWTVKLREPLTFKDGKGFFIAGPQESQGQKRYEAVMVANTGGITSLVSVQMIEASHATITDAVVRDMLKTVTVRPTVPESERLAVLPYKIGDLAKFRVVRSAREGVAILTDGPKDEVVAVEQPFLLIGLAPGAAPKPEDRDAFAKRVFSTAPGIKDIKITRAEALRIGQAQGYEIVADAKDSAGTDVTTVQWLRFGQNAYLQMFAIVRKTAWNDVFPRLRQIRDSIEPR